MVLLEGVAAERTLLALGVPFLHAAVVVDVLGKTGQLDDLISSTTRQQTNRTFYLSRIGLDVGQQHVKFGVDQAIELVELPQKEKEVGDCKKHRFEGGGVCLSEVGHNCEHYAQPGHSK